jgi:hypothetical protein
MLVPATLTPVVAIHRTRLNIDGTRRHIYRTGLDIYRTGLDIYRPRLDIYRPRLDITRRRGRGRQIGARNAAWNADIDVHVDPRHRWRC